MAWRFGHERSVEAETPARVWGEIHSLARETGLTAYGAAYLDLAVREGLPLAALDTELRKAARKVGVAIMNP
jgi:predicted nucleic acid-binding protein